MSKKSEKLLFDIHDLNSGIFRELADGISTRIFPGERVMISVVRVEPNAKGKVHSHSEEQWGFLTKGNLTRFQGGKSFEASEGNFWRTPSDVMHGVTGGPEGAIIPDIFAPPRSEYLKNGIGFGEDK